MGNKDLTHDRLKDMYVKMLRVRMFEEKADEIYLKGLIPGSVHLSIGQEAVSVGVVEALGEDGVVIGSHRSHGYCVAKGMDVGNMFAELLGKETGTCKGRGGSMHIMDVNKGMMGAIAIVGQQLPIATGIGLALTMKKEDRVCACFFGDGASNAGAFHESLNIASLWKLPVIYVCENNHYALSVPVSCSTSVEDIAQRASAYGMPGEVVDGMDIVAVYGAAKEAAERARKGEGPSLIECKTYRYRGHSRGDPPYGAYRSKEELDSWKERDPISKVQSDLNLSEEEVESITKDIIQEYEEAARFAEESPYPGEAEALEYIYA